MHEGGTAFDKMKAFAMAQVEANNAKIAELESKLSSVEDDYNAQLADAEKAVEESKNAYENVLTRGEEVHEKRMAAQTEHRAALARAEEEYRKKIAEIEDEYNNANAHANKILAEKEVEINAESDAIDAEKETAKNNFLDKQAAVNGIKDKIAADVPACGADSRHKGRKCRLPAVYGINLHNEYHGAEGYAALCAFFAKKFGAVLENEIIM